MSAAVIQSLWIGEIALWGAAILVISTALVAFGKYKIIESGATLLAMTLTVASVASAIAVFSTPERALAGLVPSVEKVREADPNELLPWLGFALSGAAGMLWTADWLKARGYAGRKPGAPIDRSPRDTDRLQRWLRLFRKTNAVALLGGLIPTVAFLVLGAELLEPKGLVPEQEKMGGVMSRLLGEVWGRAGENLDDRRSDRRIRGDGPLGAGRLRPHVRRRLVAP